MDLSSATLAGLAAIGIINVATMFFPNLNSEFKFTLSAFAAFIVIALIPQSLQSQLLEWIKQALIIAFAASGGYKIAQKAGGV